MTADNTEKGGGGGGGGGVVGGGGGGVGGGRGGINPSPWSLSQQGVWVSFWTLKPLKSIPQDTPKNL